MKIEKHSLIALIHSSLITALSWSGSHWILNLSQEHWVWGWTLFSARQNTAGFHAHTHSHLSHQFIYQYIFGSWKETWWNPTWLWVEYAKLFTNRGPWSCKATTIPIVHHVTLIHLLMLNWKLLKITLLLTSQSFN